MDADSGHVCKSYVGPGSGKICKDGFYTTLACTGERCWGCGGWYAERHVPVCMRDEVPKHLADGTGAPLFRMRQATDSTAPRRIDGEGQDGR